MASSAHFYLNWAKERADEMDAVLSSLEGKSAQVAADSRAAAEKFITDLRAKRDAFFNEMQQQAAAGESTWQQTKIKLETHWSTFQDDVKQYVEVFGQQATHQKVAFEGCAAAQLKAWREAADKMQAEIESIRSQQANCIRCCRAADESRRCCRGGKLQEADRSWHPIVDGIDRGLVRVPRGVRPGKSGCVGRFQAGRLRNLTVAAKPMAIHAASCDFAAGAEGSPFTSRRYRAQAALMGSWPCASRRASGSAGPLQSRRRSLPWSGPTALRPMRYISPRNSARQGTKFDARHQTVHPRYRRSMSPDSAPARTSNVSSCDSPLRQSGYEFAGPASLIVSSASGTSGAVLKPQLGQRGFHPACRIRGR